MFYKFNIQPERKVWVKSYGRCKHISDPAMPTGYRAMRKQKRKAQRSARKVNKP